MIYILTVIASVTLSFMMLVSEALGGNITHVKNGREPNAGACIHPTIPCVPLFFCFIAWLAEKFIKEYSIVVMVLVFTALYILWTIGYMKLKAEIKSLTTKQTTANKAG